MTVRPASPEAHIGTYYAVAFGALGFVLPFFSLWLDARGMSPGMIGVTVAAPSVAMILTTVLIGRRIDGLGEPRAGIVLLNAAVLVLNAALVFAHGEWAILVLWTLGGMMLHAAMPASDALALDVTRRRGTDWARLRMFGSIGFVVAVLVGGAVFERLGLELFLGMLIATSALRLLASARLPSARAPAARGPKRLSDDASGVPPVDEPTVERAAGESLYRPGVLLTLAGAALINASHAFFYAFGLLVWTRAGVGETLGGVLWGAGVVAEVALMWRFGAIARRVSARACLLLAGAAGLVRWSITAFEPGVGWLLFAQSLHAATFGLMFLSTASFIARRVASHDAVRGQSLSATFAASTMAGATWGVGWVYEDHGAGAAYLCMAALCALGMTLVGASYRTALD